MYYREGVDGLEGGWCRGLSGPTGASGGASTVLNTDEMMYGMLSGMLSPWTPWNQHLNAIQCVPYKRLLWYTHHLTAVFKGYGVSRTYVTWLVKVCLKGEKIWECKLCVQVSMGSSILDTTSESLFVSDCSWVVDEGALFLGATDGFRISAFDCWTLWKLKSQSSYIIDKFHSLLRVSGSWRQRTCTFGWIPT